MSGLIKGIATKGGGLRRYSSAEWRKVNSVEVGIRNSKIDKATRIVLKSLRSNGHLVYLVGGCVRDLILNRTPKDFDVITSASLYQVRSIFPRCLIVGKRYPICHVHHDNSLVEVSSFSTVPNQTTLTSKTDVRKPRGCSYEDYLLWKDCFKRDFTISSLMFDPYSRIVYDFVGGIKDIKNSRVSTVIPAGESFTEDKARILRAFRIAARLGFKFSKEITTSLKELSYSVTRLNKVFQFLIQIGLLTFRRVSYKMVQGRIMMEMNYMLAYGSAEASLRLMWKYGLLELLLPLQAAYFVTQGFRRRDKGSNLLLSLFSTLDSLLSPDQPCHSSLWVSILAFHKALADHPRDPLVIAAFCLALHNGRSVSEAIHIAKSNSRPHDSRFQELLDPQALIDENLSIEVKNLAVSVESALSKMTDKSIVSQAMAKYPKAPSSDMVFISSTMQHKTDTIISCVIRGREKGFVPKHGSKINYEALAAGNLTEVRYVLSRIIFDTVYPLH